MKLILLDIFQQLTANGVKNAAYVYVRKNTNYNSPVTDLASKDLRCNVGGESGANTSTVSVAAGSSVTFSLDTAVYHQGPVSVYMAKAPGKAADFDGSGNVWFKILDIGPKFPGGTWDLKGTAQPHLHAFIEMLILSPQLHTLSTSQSASPAESTC